MSDPILFDLNSMPVGFNTESLMVSYANTGTVVINNEPAEGMTRTPIYGARGDIITYLEEEKEEIYRLVEISPSAAVVESWKEIELAAKDKVVELVKNTESLQKIQRRPLSHLELSGALIPSTARAIRDLESLRNQAAHTRDLKLSKENLLEYVVLARAITKQIRAITELPKQKLSVLTLLIAELNHLIDTGQYSHISIEDVHTQIENKNIIEYLRNETAWIQLASATGGLIPKNT